MYQLNKASLFNTFFLLAFDLISIVIALFIAFTIRLKCDLFEHSISNTPMHYFGFILFYFSLLFFLYLKGIYTKRHDFWQEFELIIKALFISSVIVLAFLSLTKQTESYSRFILLFSFILLVFILPLQKIFLKRILFNIGLWQHKAHLIGNDPFFEEHVFTNPFLGYIKSDSRNAKTLFISSNKNANELESILHDALINNQNVVFIPLIKNFDFSDAQIIHLFNARSNLIIVENNLMNHSNRVMKFIIDYTLSLLIFPFLLLAIGIISLLIKLEEPRGSIFFSQLRLGKNTNTFNCYKFRTMYEKSEDLLKSYLIQYPEEIENYEIYHKYKNDPRITRIGAFLRKTSLDELPQIFNIFKGEMSLIGPRPYMIDEQKKIGYDAGLIFSVKPGITGLWQVNGRSDTDFMTRIELDKWYVRNWSIWKDITILIKTIQVVLLGKGAS